MLVKKFDNEFPSRFIDEMLDYMDITEEQFWSTLDNARSPHLWEKVDGKWQIKDSIKNHVVEDGVEQARVHQNEDRTFSKKNRNLYYNVD